MLSVEEPMEKITLGLAEARPRKTELWRGNGTVGEYGKIYLCPGEEYGIGSRKTLPALAAETRGNTVKHGDGSSVSPSWN